MDIKDRRRQKYGGVEKQEEEKDGGKKEKRKILKEGRENTHTHDQGRIVARTK